MKFMIASDLHGMAEYTEQLMEAWRREGADRLLLLGDLLWSGLSLRRPDLFDGEKTAQLLNGIAPDITAVRGNCDRPEDLARLRFPLPGEAAVSAGAGVRFVLTHGHRPAQTGPAQPEGTVLLSGHTHVPSSYRTPEGLWRLNPGSVSLPRDGSPNSYLTAEDGVFYWKILPSGEIYRELNVLE